MPSTPADHVSVVTRRHQKSAVVTVVTCEFCSRDAFCNWESCASAHREQPGGSTLMTAFPCGQRARKTGSEVVLPLTTRAGASCEEWADVARRTGRRFPVKRPVPRWPPWSQGVRGPMWGWLMTRGEVTHGRAEIHDRSSAPLSRCLRGGPPSGPATTRRPCRPLTNGRSSR